MLKQLHHNRRWAAGFGLHEAQCTTDPSKDVSTYQFDSPKGCQLVMRLLSLN